MTQKSFTDRALSIQGFSGLQDQSFQKVRPWLRFTPTLSTVWISTGTALASPTTLFTFSLVSAFGASRAQHPFDQLYNRAIRPFIQGDPLPDNPAPRRFAMALAAAWAASAAGLLATGHRKAGTITGGLLGLSGAIVASTNFCLGSSIYRLIESFSSRSNRTTQHRNTALNSARAG